MKYNAETVKMATYAICSQDSYWCDIYDRAPAGAKRRLEVAFWGRMGLAEREDLDLYRAACAEADAKLSFWDAVYLAKSYPACGVRARYRRIAVRLQIKEERTKEVA